MTGHTSFCLLLFLTGCCDCMLPGTISPGFHGDTTRYCRICANHTMCQFPLDVEGALCLNLEDDHVNEKDIAMILDWHNVYRNTIASGKEQRGNPGPQRPAKHMMELIWDDELAHIAARWALQCNLFEKDQCRDVERFGVWQNVHVLDMDSVGNSTSTARIHFHIQSWYDEVEDFDSAEFGYVNFTGRANLSYIPFASASVTCVGCGRVIHTVPFRAVAPTAAETPPVRFGKRVETLVCNYGPLDRKTPGELYEDGDPGLCPPGTIRSQRYGALCQKFQERSSRRKAYRGIRERQQQKELETNTATLLIPHAVYLGQLISLLYLSI